jgi:hypothetical protein
VGKQRVGKGDEVQEGDRLRSDVLSWQQTEITGGEHAASEGTHEGVCLQVKIAKHFIGVPATDKANDVSINPSAQEGHSSPSMETTGGDVLGINTKGEVEGSSTEAEHSSDASGGDRSGFGRRRKKTEVEQSCTGGHCADGGVRRNG